jgi:ABC-2 type transport system ATP-binding protein
MSILSVKNLVKNYKEVKAVKGISFDVQKGEIYGLLGPNGAGKSTTLRILATVLQPTSGVVELDSISLSANQKEYRKNISYLPEEAGAYKNLTGMDYLNFMANIFATEKKDVKKYVDYAVEICNLKDRLKQKIATYSKGMTRKILLARTIMSRSKFVILDEPTSGLDVINAYDIRNIIKDLSKEGVSVLLSSHNMLEAEYLSDRISIINKGEIIAENTPKNLTKKNNAENLEEVFIKLTK